MRAVHVVVPDGIDDPARPSGGNVFDRRVCHALGSLGWAVHEHPVPGFWGRPDAVSFAALAEVVRAIPDGAAVLIDGLIASTASDVLVHEAPRLRLVVLVHMPLGHQPAGGDRDQDGVPGVVRTRESAVLGAAAAVITTSAWTRQRLGELYALPADRMYVAEPAVDRVDAAGLATGTADGGALLCVAAVTPQKGHDVLLDSLIAIADLTWECLCVGRLDRDPAFVRVVRRRLSDAGLHDRVRLAGPRTGPALDRTYAAADLMVLASRAETYGMVIAEALAHGVPVLTAEVGGVTEAVGHGADGTRPGVLVAPADPVALAAALRQWLTDAALRERLRRAARERRTSLPTWPATAAVIADVLTGVL